MDTAPFALVDSAFRAALEGGLTPSLYASIQAGLQAQLKPDALTQHMEIKLPTLLKTVWKYEWLERNPLHAEDLSAYSRMLDAASNTEEMANAQRADNPLSQREITVTAMDELESKHPGITKRMEHIKRMQDDYVITRMEKFLFDHNIPIPGEITAYLHSNTRELLSSEYKG